MVGFVSKLSTISSSLEVGWCLLTLKIPDVSFENLAVRIQEVHVFVDVSLDVSKYKYATWTG